MNIIEALVLLRENNVAWSSVADGYYLFIDENSDIRETIKIIFKLKPIFNPRTFSNEEIILIAKFIKNPKLKLLI